MPWEGGHVKMLFAVERPKVHWSVDGKSILYASTKNGVRNIWSRSLAGGEPKAVTGFMDNEDIRWFAVSPKAPQVAVARGTVIRDVVRIQDLK
jgi:hypothetical protein